MQAILEVDSGTHKGLRVPIPRKEGLRVGRYHEAGLSLADDAMMSNVHFALEWRGTSCFLQDQGSRFGTQVNGTRVTDTVLVDGDQIMAGQTKFVVRFTGASAAQVPMLAPAVAASPDFATPTKAGDVPTATAAELGKQVVHEHVLGYLRGMKDPLYAILDAARQEDVPALLEGSKLQYQSLYEGIEGQAMADAAPYLVRLTPESPLLETLVRRGWGDSWGIYLTSLAPFAEVRKHFRRFLLVKLADGEEVYFRYYDPRVLRVFLPTCTPQEAAQFFGPIVGFLAEDQEIEKAQEFRFRDGEVRMATATLLGSP